MSAYITSWDDEWRAIKREQEADARESLDPVECRQCGMTFWTDDPDETICGSCEQGSKA